MGAFVGRHSPERWAAREKVLKGIAMNPRPAGELLDTFAVVCGGRRGRVTDVLAWLRDRGLVNAPPLRTGGLYTVTETGEAAVRAMRDGARLEAWLAESGAERPEAS